MQIWQLTSSKEVWPDIKIAVGPSAPPIIPIELASLISMLVLLNK